ncbi:hypothetical protein TWF481_009846 [Arthrobotrys musiformis]|uniref:Pentatricopeptide repeat protein n=1 Tax=Arthrobotrys musiformis TaxID=47236 RepID=A0AAV9W640_9PEZI
MTALPSAARPLTRLAQSSSLISRSNASALQSICYRCQALALKDSPHAQLFLAGHSQRRYLNIKWGTKDHVPGVKAGRKSKRQRLIEAGKKAGSMGVPQLTTDELRDTYAPELFVFRSDIASGNINAAMQSLTNLVELEILRHSDTHNLTQALHEAYRSKSLPKKAVIEYLTTVIEYLKSGQLPKHYLAHVRILSTLKEAEEWELGNEYWNWLKDQNLEHLNARVFGAVIEFLAYQGAPLEELEGLYSQALEKFSKAEDVGGGTQHRATSLTLVQGIITARLLNQDWKGAYDALDVAARLHPTQVPTRVYELFILNRPVREGYLVFLMACRAGTKLSGKTLMWIMSNWWKVTMDAKGLLQLILAHFAIGGKSSVMLLNKVIFGLLGRLPEAPEPPAPLGSLIQTELEGGVDERTAEEKEKESKEWEEWERKMEEYQAAVNPMFGTIRRTIELFDGMNVEPDIMTYCNIISQASRRHLRQIVAAAMREIDSSVRGGKATMDESPYRVILGACGSLADQDGVKKAWEGLVAWRAQHLKDNLKNCRPGTVFTGQLKGGAKDHELMSWKALIRAGFDAGMKPYILEQLNKYQHQFGARLTSEIRLEIVRREGSLQKSLKNEAEMLATAVRTGKDSIDLTSNPATIAQRPKLLHATGVPETNYTELRAEVEEYNRVLDVLERVIRSTVAYDFSTLDLDLNLIEIPEMSEDDITQLKEVYEHFQKNMPRNPWMTATHDPKTDLTGLILKEVKNTQQEKKAGEEEGGEREDRGMQDGAWGEGRSVTGYSVNQLRFENWISINRLLYLAQQGISWREKNGGGPKGVVSGYNRREVGAREAIKRVEGLEGKEWEEGVLALRSSLIGTGPVPQHPSQAAATSTAEVE